MTSHSLANESVEAVFNDFPDPLQPKALEPSSDQSKDGSFKNSVGEPNELEPLCKRQKLEIWSDVPRAELVSGPHGCSSRGITTGCISQFSLTSTTSRAPLSSATILSASSTPTHEKTIQRRVRPLFPSRPSKYSRQNKLGQDILVQTQNTVIKKGIQVRSHVSKAPSSAPHYKSQGLADYHPWKGLHIEDVLSELTTKQGFYDKIQISQNETSTARPSVWSSLKHKSGLQILSSLFVSVLIQRQNHGTITANCTFKPPPRVTLTDTKREGWLRDLADPAISLRRLSRTIPHGVRGKTLLDHCLAKKIPLARAVWLAKCVGANEIRAFKRKGTSGAFAIGGETKWIRDWTTNVQAFVENIIAGCGSLHWRDKIDYCLRLVGHLFSEHLLHRDQYLEWITLSLKSSDLDSMFAWLLVVQIHWKEILKYRQRGRHLVEAILVQLAKASEPDKKEAFAALIKHLALYIRSFMMANPACFLLPFCWNKYAAILRVCLMDNDTAAVSCFQRLSERNLRLQRPSMDKSRRIDCLYQQQLVALLDRLYAETSIWSFADECLKTYQDHTLLISTCLDWATSLARNGHARVYIVVRLFRRWAVHHVELEHPVFQFLATNPDLPHPQRAGVFQLLAELIHSNHLSVVVYFQWLIAKGVLANHKNTKANHPPDLQWLCELPLDGLPAHVVNLKQILQASLGISIEREKDNLAVTKSWIASKVQDFFPPSQVPKCQTPQSFEISQSSQTVKSAAGRWIRHSLASCLLTHHVDCNSGSSRTSPMGSNNINFFELDQFQSIRCILEKINEFPVLADVIKICSVSEDVTILTAATDTVNYHFEIFFAIGAVNSLFQELYRRHEDFSTQKTIDKAFIESLLDLSIRIPGSRRKTSKLQATLILIEQGSQVAAFSPISDHMAEGLESTESAFADEIEQVLSSGNVMGDQVFDQIFKRITQQLRFSWARTAEQPAVNLVELLNRLRKFGTAAFERLCCEWVDEILLSSHRPALSAVMPPFVCIGTITLKVILERTVYLLINAENSSHAFALALEALELITLPALDIPPLTNHRLYRFHVQQHGILRGFSSLITPILRATIDASLNAEYILRERARKVIESSRIIPILQGLLQQDLANSESISYALEEGHSVCQVQQAIDWILFASDDPDPPNTNLYNQVLKVLRRVTVFNAPLCKLKLKAILAKEKQINHAVDTLILVVKDEARTANKSYMRMWSTLLSELPLSQVYRIRERAESELLSFLRRTPGSALDQDNGVMHSMMSILDTTSVNTPDYAPSMATVQMTEKVVNLLLSCQYTEQILKAENLPTNVHMNVPTDTYVQIDMLLRMLSVNYSVFRVPNLPESNLVPSIISLSLLLVSRCLTGRSQLAEHVFDVLTILTDYLSDDARYHCVCVLRDKYRIRDSRLLFIFGSPECVDSERLQLLSTSLSTSSPKAEAAGLGGAIFPFPIRQWEIIPDATPLITENDTSLSLTLFDTRGAVL